jgi:hypothetical protein
MRGFGGDPRLRAALRLARYVQESPEARSMLRHGTNDARRRIADRLGMAGLAGAPADSRSRRTGVGNITVDVDREPLRGQSAVALRGRMDGALVDRLSPREARDLARVLLDAADDADRSV